MRVQIFTTTFFFAVAFSAPAAAQPLTRVDVAGFLSWLNANKSGIDSYNDWYNRSALGSVSLGWYFTDHLKTELEVGASTPAELYAVQPVDIQNVRTHIESEYRFSTRRLVAAQQYQFFRNAWAHPHVAAGIDLTWERTERTDDPVLIFDNATRTPRTVRPETVHNPSTDFKARLFGELGAKLYLTPRTFFRSDLRLVFNGGLDEVLLRFGCGVDF